MKRFLIALMFMCMPFVAQAQTLQPFDMTGGSCVTIYPGIPWVSPYIDLSTSAGVVGYFITLSATSFAGGPVQLSYEQTGNLSQPFTATCGSVPSCATLITDGVGGWAMPQASITSTTTQAVAIGGVGSANGGAGNLVPVSILRFVITNNTGYAVTTCTFTVWKE